MNEPALNLAGKTSLGSLAALLEMTTAVIGADSGAPSTSRVAGRNTDGAPLRAGFSRALRAVRRSEPAYRSWLGSALLALRPAGHSRKRSLGGARLRPVDIPGTSDSRRKRSARERFGRTTQEGPGEVVKRLLVVKLGDIGDAILATPALRALHTTWPEAEIDVLCSTNGARRARRASRTARTDRGE